MEVLFEKVRKAISRYEMIKTGDSVITALSGGADSVCLLLVLLEFRREFNLTIEAIHINHMLRGAESDYDEEFCIKMCRQLEIPLITEHCDVSLYARENKQSVEEAARDIRYNAFKKHSEGIKLATAHTASDNAETVIHNLTRGTGLKGLLGVPPIRNNIIRPLIFVTRSEVEEYLRSVGQSYVTDSTNFSDNYTRNKIRHNIIPVLKEINSSFENTVSSDIMALELENSFIEQQADAAFNECFREPFSLCSLNKYHKVIRCRCIIMLLKMAGISYNQNRINDIDRLLMLNGKINVSGDYYVTAINGDICITVESLKKIENIEFELEIGQNLFSKTKICYVESVDSLCADIDCSHFYNKKLNICFIDYDRINGKLKLRNRRNGDRIKFADSSFTSNVKKIFNKYVPIKQRSELCFVSDSEGPVFIEEFGIADRVKPDKNTHNILKISIKIIS